MRRKIHHAVLFDALLAISQRTLMAMKALNDDSDGGQVKSLLEEIAFIAESASAQVEEH